jgi:hypothetical protein
VRPDVGVGQVRPALVGFCRECVREQATLVLDDERGTLPDVPRQVSPRLVPRLLEAGRRRNLRLELLPETA